MVHHGEQYRDEGGAVFGDEGNQGVLLPGGQCCGGTHRTPDLLTVTRFRVAGGSGCGGTKERFYGLQKVGHQTL